MLTLLSPSKKLDYDRPGPAIEPTPHALAKETELLARTTRKLSRADLRRLMDISEPLADLNFHRFQDFDPQAGPNAPSAKPAILAFSGDVYLGLKAHELDAAGLEWAQDRLRILSGFYGLLRPLDAMQPYRLEMGTKLKTKRGEDLYDFWGPRLSERLNEALAGHDDRTIVNLASNEYFKAVERKALQAQVVTPVFKDIKDGKARALFMFLKQARGAMARWIIEERIDTADRLTEFAGMGYRFDPALSNEANGDLVFTRNQPPAMR